MAGGGGPDYKDVLGSAMVLVGIAFANEAVNPPLEPTRLISETLPGDAEIVTVRWELGDGNTAIGESVTHDYAAIGSYTSRLSVEDANGQVDALSGTVSVAERNSIFGSAGPVEEILELDGTLDSALGSIGTTVRGVTKNSRRFDHEGRVWTFTELWADPRR